MRKYFCRSKSILCRPQSSLMMMMMMMMMMMICFCGVVDQRKAFSLISSRIHCQRSSTSRFSDTPRAGFEPVQKPISGLTEWSCGVVVTHYTSASKYFPFLFACFAFPQKYTELFVTSVHDLVYINIAQTFVLGRVLVWQFPHKKWQLWEWFSLSHWQTKPTIYQNVDSTKL